MTYFQHLDDVWNTQEEPASQYFKIGPFTVQISSHNRAAARFLTEAFNHLASDADSPDLIIRIWPEIKLPPLDWNLIQTNGYRGFAKPPFYFHYFETIGALSAIDVERGIAYYAIRDLDKLPWWVRGSPLQVIFHLWFREKGIQLTHSASIANEKGAILLSGKGGSGKSTTVLASLEEGLSTLGEDYILLSPESAYSIYQTAKWKPHTRTLFPSYESSIANRDTANQEKALVHYTHLFPHQLIRKSPIHAVVSLRIGDSADLQKSDLNGSMQSLLLSTVTQLPHPDPRTSKVLYETVKSLDHYSLSLGPNLKENVAILKGLLR